jgi:histidinol phosphatase-like enzyme
MGSKHHLWSIYIDLAGILIRLDQPEQADIYRQKARTIVEEIAEGLEVLDLSQSFLMQPRVRDLMRK